jgi:hypothetical protein
MFLDSVLKILGWCIPNLCNMAYYLQALALALGRSYWENIFIKDPYLWNIFIILLDWLDSLDFVNWSNVNRFFYSKSLD